jgi:hypothetical protein
LRRAEPGPTPFSAQGQNSSSYRGTLSFTEVDAKDLVTITTAYNTDAVWSAGTLTAAQITAITSGFTADSNGGADYRDHQRLHGRQQQLGLHG